MLDIVVTINCCVLFDFFFFFKSEKNLNKTRGQKIKTFIRANGAVPLTVDIHYLTVTPANCHKYFQLKLMFGKHI